MYLTFNNLNLDSYYQLKIVEFQHKVALILGFCATVTHAIIHFNALHFTAFESSFVMIMFLIYSLLREQLFQSFMTEVRRIR